MEPQQNICTTCLSNDRSLTPLSKISSILQEINLLEPKNPGFVCWECTTIIMKFYTLKMRCKQAETVLSNHRRKPKSLSSLGHTTKSFYDYHFNYNDPHTDSEFADKFLINDIKHEIDDTDVKHETDIYAENIQTHIDNVVISTEYEDNRNQKKSGNYHIPTINKELTGVIHIDQSESVLSDIDIPEVESSDTEHSETDIKRKEKKFKKKETEKVDKSSHEEVLEKFDFVVFTEEEIMRNREDKRNQPNYKKIPFKCNYCVLGFTKEVFYQQHMEKKHGQSKGAFPCPVCSTRFPTTRAMERHKNKHYSCYRCRLCKYDTLELWSAVNHSRVKHSDDSKDCIHCPQCRQVCRTPEDLSKHVKEQHSLYCTECGVKFKNKHSLRTHRRRIHAVVRSFQCDLCKKTFTNKSRLESHIVSHNANIAMKLAYCAICDVQYKNLYIYRSHLRNSINHSKRSYSCPDCNKKFSSKFYRTQHYNFYHLKKSSYKCDVCGKLFISDWRLKDHKQTKHGGNRARDHPCTVCGKKFFTISTLRGHQLTHSEQRTYMCEDCGDTFRQRAALYTHARLVHKAVRRKRTLA